MLLGLRKVPFFTLLAPLGSLSTACLLMIFQFRFGIELRSATTGMTLLLAHLLPPVFSSCNLPATFRSPANLAFCGSLAGLRQSERAGRYFRHSEVLAACPWIPPGNTIGGRKAYK